MTPPRFWQFVFAILSLLAALDVIRLRPQARVLGSAGIPRGAALFADRSLDLAFGSMKWMQYAYLRAAALALMLLYFVVTTLLALRSYTVGFEASSVTTWLVLLAGAASLSACLLATLRYARQFKGELDALEALCRRSRLAQDKALGVAAGSGIWERLAQRWSWLKSRIIGYDDLLGYNSIVYSSFARLRSTWIVSLVVVTIIVCGTIRTLIGNDDTGNMLSTATPLTTLFTLRNLSLVSGLSSSTPLLLCLFAIYVWSIAGMQRARGAHLLSRATPRDGVCDGAATPIAAVLYPKRRTDDVPAQENAAEGDGGFVHLERALTNPILRLNSMSRYMAVLVVTLVLPVILFMLKPPTALEPKWAGIYMFILLVLCGFMICVNLLQFFEHWRALSALLARLETHPLAAAFERVLPIARTTVDEQLTRVPNDLAQFSVCAEEYAELVDSACWIARSETSALDFKAECARALEEQTKHPDSEQALEMEGAAGRMLIESARAVYSVIDSTSSTWKLRAQAYVATVIALVINRHMRQVRPFMWGTTAGAMLLLAATVSYPFEPHRALLTCIWIITIAVVGLGLYVFMSLDSDRLLSRIAGNAPGFVKLDRAFALRVAVWVIAPLVAVVAAQYPQVADVLGAVIDPLTRTLR